MRRSVKVFFLFGVLVAARAEDFPPPPADEKGARQMVELNRVVPGIHLEVRYATPNNFMHRVLYPQPRVFVRREVGQALSRVEERLARHHRGLLVFDGYRPWHITKMMWDETPVEKRGFVANPGKGSKHNRGGAVDLTMLDLDTGKAVEMTSGYDEFSPRAAYNAPGSPRAIANRNFLRQAMEAEGFQVLPHEWWHFDYKGWKQFPLLNYSFAELDRFQP